MRFFIYHNSVLATICSMGGASFISLGVMAMISRELDILSGIIVLAIGLGLMLLLCACASADTNYIGDWYADLFGTADELPLAYDAQSNTLTGDVSGVALVYSRRTGPEAYNGQWAATLLRLGEIEIAPRDVEFEVLMTVEDGAVCMSVCFGEETVTLNIRPQFEDGAMTVTFPAKLFGEEAVFVMETV